MPENKEYWASASDRGNVKISEDVISTIVSVAVLETEGVANLTSSITNDLVGLIGKKTASKNINIIFTYDDVEVDVSLLVKFGSTVFDTAKLVQENVKNAVESMTGLNCKVVNVTVSGISFEK